MNRCLALWAMFVLLLAGCNKSADTGKTAPTDTGKGGALSTEHLGNKIEISGSPIKIEKGKTTTVKITAIRKDPEQKETSKESVMYKVTWYQGDIRLELDTTTDIPNPATGIKMEPAVIRAGKDSVDVTLTAAPDATRGMVAITAKGTGAEPYTIYLMADVR